MTVKFYVLLLVFVLFSNQEHVYSQNTSGRIENSVKAVKSVEQLNIENEIKKLKQEDRIENLPRILDLNTKLEKITGSGKIVSCKAGKSHILTKKSPKRKRILGSVAEISATDYPRIRRLLAK